MIHEGLPVSVVFVDLFITGTKTTTTGSVRTGVYTNKYVVIASSHRVCLRHTRTHTWSNAFLLSFFAEFSIKVCLPWKSKSHRVSWPVVDGHRLQDEDFNVACKSIGDQLMHCRAHVSLPAAGVITNFVVREARWRSIGCPKMLIFFQTNKLRPSLLPNEHRSFETKCRQMATAPYGLQNSENNLQCRHSFHAQEQRVLTVFFLCLFVCLGLLLPGRRKVCQAHPTTRGSWDLSEQH